MKKRILSLFLALVMTASMLPVIAVGAAGESYQPPEITSDYFYHQLNDRAKAIYDKLLDEFTGDNKAQYYAGTKPIDLIDVTYGSGSEQSGQPIITETDIANYRNGNKDIFNDFCASKDALDLDHSELWYIDSGYLTFRVTHSSVESHLSKGYHVLIGPGRGKTYLLGGQVMSKSDVETMIDEVDSAINKIVTDALSNLNRNDNASQWTEQDKIANLVDYVHDRITEGIHYRYEIDCRNNGQYAKYIRTLYGIVSHEGVCEAYSRTLQVCLTKLGINCVLIHGVQSKGTPEDHMWNAVNIPEDDNTDHWYVVDATWDDPMVANYDGTRDLTFKDGLDGREKDTYLLVGQATVGEYWNPSGYVSTGMKEFKYPTIETYGYSGAEINGDFNGIEVKYSAGGTMEDNTPAGVFVVTYNGMNAAKAREQGYYFLFKMYDYHPDGTADVMDEWYYADASFFLASESPYFGDTPNGIRVYSATCEYVDIAVTTRKPDHRDEWSTNPLTSYLSQNFEAGYFHGDESEIVAETGMLYNMNAGYEAPPYVATQTPAPNGNVTAGYQYRYKVTYDDLLYHILPTDENAHSGIAAIDAYSSDYERANQQPVQLRYVTEQEDLHNYHAVVAHQVVGELPFDTNRDGVVDMPGDNNDNEYVNFKWIYATAPIAEGGRGLTECPNKTYHDQGQEDCDVNKGCPIVGVEFNFKASDQWIDDVTQYTFIMEGLVGSRSGKFPNNFSSIAVVPGLCPACYRSQGIDWNLWGQPTLLDSPEDLDLDAMAKAGGTDAATLQKLNEEMNRDDINGRLMLVVENKSKGAGNRAEYEEINSKMEAKAGLTDSDILASSVFEINFNRICPMVKLQPDRNQSLRVQVGYPAGITYDMLTSGDSNIELKAYHFTRCSEINESGTEYKCDVLANELKGVTDKYEQDRIRKAHEWGEHIVGVDEITMIPTPYGMVIMCNAFSPFEIVAVKKTDSTPAAAAETGSTLVVVSGDNGTVSVVGEGEAVGAAGNVSFANASDSKTFKVTPDEGFEVDSVVLGGQNEPITVNADGTFEVSGISGNNVLSVTFIPKTVKADEAEFGEPVVAKVCQHPADKRQTTASKEPTCTENGTTVEIKCTECGAVVQAATVIPATGHQNVVTRKDAVKATCTENGKTAELFCNDCKTTISIQSTIQALGHLFTNYKEGARDCHGVTLTATCDRDGCNVIDTKVNPDGRVDHEYTIPNGTTEPTCTQDATKTLKCKWCDLTKTETVPNTATGHTPKADGSGVCEKCEAYICAANNHNYQPTEKVLPTCTAPGHEAGRKCTVCGHWEVREKTIPALGHDFDGHSAGTKCSRCDTVMKNDNHTYVDMPQKAATCDDEGSSGGKWCSECYYIDPDNKPTVAPALGHSWNTNSPEWHWSTDGEPSAAVTLTCTRDGSHKETFEAEIQLNETTTNASCNKTGVAKYTATLKVEGTETILTYINNNVVVPMTEHDPGNNPVETTSATCTHHGTKTYTCSVCGQKVVETVEGELPPHEFIVEPSKSIAPTCTQAGKNVSICAVCHEENEETVPALGHNYVNGVCTHCGAVKPSSTPSTPSAPSSGSSGGSKTQTSTGSDGSTTTTVTASDGSTTKTTTTVDGVVGTTRTDADGNVTSVEVIMPSAPETGDTVIAPVEVRAAASSEDAPEIDITVREGSARVEIPVVDVRPGTVAVIVDENGDETVVRDCVVDGNGVIITVDGSVTVKIVDRSVEFKDVREANHWASDAVEFVVARDLFKGTGEGVFSPDVAMTRGMLVTVLYRLAYEPEAAGADMTFGDVSSSDYYADAVAWADDNDVVNGYTDGSFRPGEDVSREQLVTILYRYAKLKGYATGVDGNALASFTDVQNIQGYAVDAMNWAVSTGLVNGISADTLSPQSGAKRAQVAAILERFCEKIVK